MRNMLFDMDEVSLAGYCLIYTATLGKSLAASKPAEIPLFVLRKEILQINWNIDILHSLIRIF